MDLSTASQTDDDETLVETMLNMKRSAAKDKRKAIMQESESLKKTKKKEMMQIRQEQKVEEEIAQQEDVVAKQAEKESSKKDGGRLKRKTSKAREDKDKRQKMQDDLEKLTLMEYVEVIFDSEEIMFEPDGDDEVWENHHSQELIEWKLYDSSRVHSLMLGENGNSFEPIAETTTDDAGTVTTRTPSPVTMEEKAKKKNDENLNLKFLRSLPSEWNTYVVVWRNKSDIDTMSLDNLYNNFKIVEQEVRGTKNTNTSSQNMDFVSSPNPNSTNEVLTVFGTGKKSTINGSDIAGYGKAKVECFNCHKMGYFSRECRVPRNQENKTRNQETIRRTVNVEDTSYKAMVVIAGAGFDWSYMADDEAPTNIASMALPDSEKTMVHHLLRTENQMKRMRFNLLVRKRERLLNLVWISYNVVPPPHTKRFSPLRIELSHTSLPEFAKPSVQSYEVKSVQVMTQKSSVKLFSSVKENNGNISYLSDFKEFDGGYVTFGGGAKGGKITGKGTIKTSTLDFEDVYFVKELQFNLLVSHRRVTNRTIKNNMYSVDMKNIVPKKDLTCLIAKTTNDDSMLWHKRLATKNKTSRIFKSFITEIENLVDKKVKIFRCDNGIEFKNRVMNEFCKEKGIKREYSVARTPHHNRVVERRNMTLIKAARTMLANSKLPITFWAEAINTACYVKNTNDGSLFDSSPKDSDGDTQYNDGLSTKSEIENPKRPNNENSTKDINTIRPSINTASSNINTVRLSDDFFVTDNDMRSLDGVELDISNISTTYPVPTTSNTRIKKDHSLDNVIGDMQSGVQTRRMTVTTDEQGTQKDYQCTKRSSMGRSNGRRTLFVSSIKGLDTSGFSKRSVLKKKALTMMKFFSHVARIEAIRLFLAYASFRRFLVYQIDVKSAFLYERIEEEVYVCQPPGFEDPDYPDKVYKVEKPLYGLHQAPRAWYETLAKYLFDNGFHKGKIHQTMFIKRQKEDILLVQVYVDDIIFGSTKKELCTEFEDKYVDEILTKFMYEDVKPVSTLMDKEKALLKDSNGDDVDVHLYRLTFAGEAHHIWLSLMLDRKMIKYELLNDLTLDNREIELNATVDGHDKTITEASVRRHLKLENTDGISTLPRTKIFEQLDLMGESRSFSKVETTLFPTMLVTEQVSQGEGPTSLVRTHHAPTIIASSPYLQNISITYRKTKTRTRRMDIRIPQFNVPSSVADKAITKEATPSGPSSLRTSLEGGLGCHFTMRDSIIQARVKKLEKKLKHKRRKAVIDSLEEEEEASLDHEDSPKQWRMIEEIDKDKNGNLVKSNEQGEAHEIAEHRMDFSTASPQIVNDETLAKTLLNIKRGAVKDKGKAIMDEEYAQQVQAQWITDEARLDQENIAQAEQWDDEKEAQKQVKVLKDLLKKNWDRNKRLKKRLLKKDVVAKQAEKESFKKARGILKRKTSKAREDMDKRQKEQDDPENLTLMDYVKVVSDSEELINVIPLAVKSPVVN
nr:hypothetical protein [Tanacetum cinerariifolium]